MEREPSRDFISVARESLSLRAEVTGLSWSLALKGSSAFVFTNFVCSKQNAFALCSLALSWIIRGVPKAWFCHILRAGFALLTRRPPENPLGPDKTSPCGSRNRNRPVVIIKKDFLKRILFYYGAGDGTRTRGIFLGKEAFYH